MGVMGVLHGVRVALSCGVDVSGDSEKVSSCAMAVRDETSGGEWPDAADTGTSCD
jgi:hypothetical protein